MRSDVFASAFQQSTLDSLLGDGAFGTSARHVLVEFKRNREKVPGDATKDARRKLLTALALEGPLRSVSDRAHWIIWGTQNEPECLPYRFGVDLGAFEQSLPLHAWLSQLVPELPLPEVTTAEIKTPLASWKRFATDAIDAATARGLRSTQLPGGLGDDVGVAPGAFMNYLRRVASYHTSGEDAGSDKLMGFWLILRAAGRPTVLPYHSGAELIAWSNEQEAAQLRATMSAPNDGPDLDSPSRGPLL